MRATSNSDTPFEVAVSICCSCRYTATPRARQVSKNPTNSVRDFPIRHDDQTSTLSIAPLRIASISADLSWPAILTLPHRRRAVREYVLDSPSTLGCDASQARSICSSADSGQSGEVRA